MSSTTTLRSIAAILGALLTIDSVLAQPAGRATAVDRLHQLERASRDTHAREKALAAQWALDNDVPLREVLPDGRITEIVSVSGVGPSVKTTLNDDAAVSVSTDKVWPGGASGLSLNGSGVVLHEWDGGLVRTSHVELIGAVTWADDTSPGLSSHATHVAGTMVGMGADPSARGMAFAGSLEAYDWSDDDAEMAAAAAAGALISNHSYGWIRGWYNSGSSWYWYGSPSISADEDWQFGFYDSSARSWDQIAYNAPYYLICKSAGNDRNDTYNGGHYVWQSGSWVWSTDARGADGGALGYDSISQQGCAKNIMTVGAVNDVIGGYSSPGGVVMTSFSGWGPTDDGRIKPDIVANGAGLWSSVASSDTSYSSYSGTSMSSPSAAASMGLLVQHYRATHNNADMRAATLKGLAIHTADECGAADGPDYSFGWGLLNVAAAADHITLEATDPDAIQELSLGEGQTIQQIWNVGGNSTIKATICWTDPAGTPVAAALDPTTPMLVNDLDLRVIGPGNTVYEPWILDPADPAAAATRGDNVRDNVEVVVIDAPVAGIYKVEVTHKGTLVNGPQDFALILTKGATAPIAPPATVEEIGAFRNGLWLLDASGDDAWGAGDVWFGFGLSIDKPVTGDWDGDGIDAAGLFRDGLWFLDSNGNDQWDAGDEFFGFGLASDVPVAGDWNGDGTDDIGLFRNGIWLLDMNGNHQWDAGDSIFGFGLSIDTPVTGDWNGDGTDEVGIYRNGLWFLDSNGNTQADAGDAYFGFGASTDLPITGDWNADGTDEVGIVRNALWFLDSNGNTQADAGDSYFVFGLATDTPIAGQWTN